MIDYYVYRYLHFRYDSHLREERNPVCKPDSISFAGLNEISLHSRKFIEQSLSKIPSPPDKSLFSSVDPPSRRGVESKNRRNRNGTTVFRRFIESKRSHFACMAEGNAALRAFACFSPVTLSENPFARPFSRSTRFVSRHSPPLPFLSFFLSFLREFHAEEDEQRLRFSFDGSDLDYCSRKF